jgi:hypothetical protein
MFAVELDIGADVNIMYRSLLGLCAWGSPRSELRKFGVGDVIAESTSLGDWNINFDVSVEVWL